MTFSTQTCPCFGYAHSEATETLTLFHLKPRPSKIKELRNRRKGNGLISGFSSRLSSGLSNRFSSGSSSRFSSGLSSGLRTKISKSR